MKTRKVCVVIKKFIKSCSSQTLKIVKKNYNNNNNNNKNKMWSNYFQYFLKVIKK